ncbi:MAG: cytochrome bd ubiquinol oxidase subunit [Myxococcaceae bacterium]|nr:cytochrome bd ubiquinol oxidase subunit [Myxococcaceae bacterium]
MTPLTAARAQMEVSLGFHMIFSAIGMALPVFMMIAEGLHLRTGKPHYLALAKKWAKATSLLFAVGAVSGTALSFELGLLWPRFMEISGGTIGGAFALEGYAFFIEAIFIGLYLYGWDRLSPRVHWLSGVVVAVSGTASGVLVIAANAWMQVPGDFRLEGGKPAVVDPMAPFASPAWIPMAVHTVLAAYVALGFALAGIYALAMLRGRRTSYERSALSIGMCVAAVSAVLQLVSGHVLAQHVGHHQPVKLAAMEAHYPTQRHAPIMLGGIVDDEHDVVHGAIEIPSALSFLVGDSFDTEVKGLADVPRTARPNVFLCHVAFDVMALSGMLLIGVAAAFYFFVFRRKEPPRLVLRALVLASPLGFVAIEAGWVVAEAGRQPWTIYNVLLTKDAVTPETGVAMTFYLFVLLYLGLGTALVVLLRRLGRHAEPAEASPVAV